ncbi:MAG: S-adenosylmethionine:tRNA ribosyltransferase-isomerase [Candidatus Kariarchaeaceae archaeon]|jgi:S-adenosylmethionine:tRNA ribosyltransferase-isomerase
MEDDIIQLILPKFDISQVKFATRSRTKDPFAKLLVIDTQNQTTQSNHLNDISTYFEKGDIIVINHSATIPSSLRGKITRTNKDIEIRLAGWLGTEFSAGYDWKAITFGRGDWQEKTEDREEVQDLRIGDIVTFDNGLFLTVKQIFVKPAKFVQIQFQTDILSEELWKKIYERGKPIQYAYLEEPLAIWDQQTIFSGPPLSLEPPSAAFQFSWGVVNKLIRKGVKIVPILHSAGLSSSGNEEVDSFLPLPERYEITKESAEIIQNAKAEGRKIIALGTSVVRALEANALNNHGKIIPTNDITDFVINMNYRPQIVTGVISGMHIPEESHMQILLAFANEELIIEGYNLAIENEFLWHEYGDITLIC